MAEEDDDSSQEKTEEPTARRIEKAREEGQVPRSKELNTTALLVAGAGGLLIFGASLGDAFTDLMAHSFSMSRDVIFDPSQMAVYLLDGSLQIMSASAPLMLLLFVAAFGSSLFLGGWLLAPKSLVPKFSRMDPIKGIQRMFSLKALVELAKAVAKVSVILFFAVLLLRIQTAELLGIGTQDTIPAMAHAAWMLGWSFLLLSATTILIAIIDVPFQIFDHQKNLRMTKQQVKDEFKDTEGKPEVKNRIRQLQRQMAERRMMQDVPQADVVITNPTHYSVALKYDQSSMDAPLVVAKGVDHVALKIREIAQANEVEVIRTPPLARAMYHHADIGQEIPSGLYMAVAQVLAYVFQLKQFKRRMATRPKMPDFPIPKEYQRDL